MQLSDRARKALPWLLLAIAVIATAAVYWPGRTGGWVFDDYPNIVDNAALHLTAWPKSLGQWVTIAVSSPASFLHRPLSSITFALNWLQGGGNPYPFKVTNIIIHVINGVLLFCMLRALLRLIGLRSGGPGIPPTRSVDPLPAEGGKDPVAATTDSASTRRVKGSGFPAIDDKAATRLALIVAAAWMLLPINLMAVLYVVQRMESLCQVFVLAGLWAYLHGRWMMLTANGSARRDATGFSLAVAGIVLGTVLGLTSKETAVLLPVFCFLAEAVVLRFARGAMASRTGNTGCGVTGEMDSGFRPAAGPGMTSKSESVAAGRGVANKEGADRSMANGKNANTVDAEPSSGPSGHLLPQGEGTEQSDKPPQQVEENCATKARHSGAARSAEPDRICRSANANAEGCAQRERHGWRESIHFAARGDKRIWALFTITLFIPAVLGFAWLLRAALSPASWSGRDFTLGQRLLTEPRVLVDYLHWTLLPNPAVLSLYHDEIVKSTGLLSPWTTLGSIALLAALIAVAVWLRKRRPLVSLGIGWFFAGNLLTATIVPLELVYEQRMYFPSIGVLLAVGALLLGRRWKIPHALPRVFVVVVALLWFGVATNLRAQEWSNPIRLAVAEAARHPESPRAVYEAGRLLFIAANYQPGQTLDASEKYLRKAAAIPGSSTLPDQALIMLADHHRRGDDAALWQSMARKLASQPTRQEDISALISLTNCYGSGICQFDVSNLQQAYAAALSRPHPIARLDGAYADFQRDILHNDALATEYLARAVAGDPSEPAYRIDLCALYARQGETEKALQQIDALRRMNVAGRLTRQIDVLEQLAEQGKQPPTPSPAVSR